MFGKMFGLFRISWAVGVNTNATVARGRDATRLAKRSMSLSANRHY